MKIACYAAGSVGTNNYVISDDNGITAIIDCDGSPAPLYQYVEQNHLKVTHILLTHGHYDHIGAVEAVKRQFHVPVYAGSEEKEVLRNSYNNLSELMGEHPFIIDATDYLEDMQKLFLAGLNITALATPGHTKGGMSYLISCDGEQVLFSGDTLFQGSVGRYDFPTSNGRALFDSIKNKLLPLADDTPVFPGHGPATSIGEERTMF